MKEKRYIECSEYVSPAVEIVEVYVECGFAGSDGEGDSGMTTPGWGGL